MEKLRFAPIIRVSTEDQEKKEESPALQKKQIEQYVNIVGGVIPDYCLKYSGQEHATGIEERKKLNALLKDASKGLFDAVIVCDASRWSRNNQKSKQGLQILRDNDIRFFVGTTEYDLYSPEQVFFLSMAVEIGEFQANQGAQKSIMVRIQKAKRGEPATRKPVGRTWSKEKGWGVKPEVKEQWQNIAKEFLAGKDFVYLGIKYKMSRSHIRLILTTRCGETWEQKFHAPRFKINETIATKVPRLLTDDIIEAIKARVQQNKTIFRIQLKHKYLLTRMLLCGHCGQALYGDASNGKPVYRHRHDKFLKGQRMPVDCNHFRYVPAGEIENSIMLHLFGTLGDVNLIEKAAKAAIPNLDELKKLQKQLNTNDKELKKIYAGKEKLLDAVEAGSFNGDDIKNRMLKYKERESLLISENADIKSKSEKIPTTKAITRRAALVKRIMTDRAYLPSHLNKMTFDEKKAFLQTVFTMANEKEERPGVYLKKTDDKKQPWEYEIKGNLNIVQGKGRLPMTEAEKRKLFHWYFEDELAENKDLFNDELKIKHSDIRLACNAQR